MQSVIRDKNELQGMDSEDEQVNDPVVVSQIKNQDANNKRGRANSGGRGGKVTPRRVRFLVNILFFFTFNLKVSKFVKFVNYRFQL